MIEAEVIDPVDGPVGLDASLAEGGTGRRRGVLLGVIGVLLLLLASGGAWLLNAGDELAAGEAPVPPGDGTMAIEWAEPVMLQRDADCVDPNNGQDIPEGAIGYEPSIAVDDFGNLYYTAHKDLRWGGGNGGPLGGDPSPPLPCVDGYSTSWDYYASWFYVSQDGGRTWAPPGEWGPGYSGSQVFVGDEGDIGVDANSRVYFIDTTLEDNWLHVWDDGGEDYIRGQRQNSQAGDDRPWVTAHQDDIVHYLGNSGGGVTDCQGSTGRYWYYRSTNGGQTFSQCTAVPGGWSHIDAERHGDHVYILQEVSDSDDSDIQVRVSDDTGLTWSEPQLVGERDSNPPEGFPWISTGGEELVAAIWADQTESGSDAWRIHVAMSWDSGLTWEDWEMVPFEGLFLYPTIHVGPDKTVAIAFYGIEAPYVAGQEWYAYAAMVRDPQPDQTFDFQRIDPTPLHTVTEAEETTRDLHALHDFFEIAISPTDGALHVAYQRNIGQHPFEVGEEQRYLMAVRGEPQMMLQSPALAGGVFQEGATCDGVDLSPVLNWTMPPDGTRSYALVMWDLSTASPFIHWVAWDLDLEYGSLDTGLPPDPVLANGMLQGTNDFSNIGYGGPCPPGDGPHLYRFQLIALDIDSLGLTSEAQAADVWAAAEGHIMAATTAHATYGD